jgi:hypothetical protein
VKNTEYKRDEIFELNWLAGIGLRVPIYLGTLLAYLIQSVISTPCSTDVLSSLPSLHIVRLMKSYDGVQATWTARTQSDQQVAVHLPWAQRSLCVVVDI